MIIKKILTLMAVGMLTCSTFAADDNSRFNAKELSLLLKSSYNLDSTTFNKDLDVGLSYYITDNIGVQSTVNTYSDEGNNTFNEVSLGLVGRIPVGIVAPYGKAGAIYGIRDSRFTAYAGGGIECRVTKRVGLFVESVYRFDDFQSVNEGNWIAAGGINIVLN